MTRAQRKAKIITPQSPSKMKKPWQTQAAAPKLILRDGHSKERLPLSLMAPEEIGHAIVEELAGLGAAVYTCSRNEAELGKCLKEWEAKGFAVNGSVCDASSKDQRQKLIDNVGSVFNGMLNILGKQSCGIVIEEPSSNVYVIEEGPVVQRQGQGKGKTKTTESKRQCYNQKLNCFK